MNEPFEFDRDSFLAGLTVGRMLWSPLLVDPDEVVRAVQAYLEEQEESEDEE